MTRRSRRPRLSFLPLTLLAVGLALTQTACPQGASLENPEQYPIISSGTAGGSGTAGAATTSKGGSGGTGGTGNAGAPATMVTLTTDMVGCDFVSILGTGTAANRGICSTQGCHFNHLPTSSLDLTANSGLVGRVKDVKAVHGDINCSTDPATFTACVPAGCPDAFLVDSADPDSSWILAKVNGTQGDCGDVMPDGIFSDDQKACVDKLVRAIAALP